MSITRDLKKTLICSPTPLPQRLLKVGPLQSFLMWQFFARPHRAPPPHEPECSALARSPNASL